MLRGITPSDSDSTCRFVLFTTGDPNVSPSCTCGWITNLAPEQGHTDKQGSLIHRKRWSVCDEMRVVSDTGTVGMKRSVSVTWWHTGWLRSNPWWWPLQIWWWMVCWEAAPGPVSWASEDLVKREEKRSRHNDGWARNSKHLCQFQTWSLTLFDFELVLQRHQLQSEELRHLLVLLLLPKSQHKQNNL